MISCGLIVQALETYDREAQAKSIEAADVQRGELLERFPRSGWGEMSLERYALGQSDHPDNFCRWMEFRAVDLGSIKGGSARKHHIYFQAAKKEWWFERDRYDSVEEAWREVRSGFVEALQLAEAGAWEQLDRVPAVQGGWALLTKTLHLYFPDQVLPICSHAHLSHFLRVLGDELKGFDNFSTVSLNRRLLDGLRGCKEVSTWSTKELERLLYTSDFSPFEDGSSAAIGNVATFIPAAIEDYGDAGIETRREAEDEARALLDAHAGQMDERQLRELLRLFNADSHRGKRYQTRFSPAFVGATANGLAANLDQVNEWTKRLWLGSDEVATESVGELLANRQLLPFSGTSYPTMLLYLRSPEKFAVWLQPTDRGLQRLRQAYQPKRSPGAGELDDYLAFSSAATDLARDYEIPPELLDAVLAAAARAEVEEAAPVAEGKVWLFQANPDIFDIDRAISEVPELTWVVRQYRNDIRKGDRVYLWRSGPEAGVIATASVLTDPEELPGISGSPYLLAEEALSKPEPRVNLRIEKILTTPLRRTDLLEHPVLKDLGVIAFANATNFEVTSEQDGVLKALIEEPASLSLPSVRPERSAALHLPQSFLENVVDMLAEKGQVIFYGPPGTGKTWIALGLAEELTREGGRADLVQFHPSYAYEDFVGGFRPREDGSASGVTYARVDGPLRRIAAEAAADPGHPYVLVVDEINRGNVPKIFGELLFLLEHRRRNVRLQYWPEAPFSLPDNLFLIGTMNTADRSIALVDAALRRRFYFVEFSPTAPPVDDVLPRWLHEHGLDDEPARLLARLNEVIDSDDFSIGPSYFMNADGTVPDLERIWTRSIMPLLHEHYYGTGWDPEDYALATLKRLVDDGPEQVEGPAG